MEETEILTRPPQVSFTLEKLGPPSALYIGPDDTLYVGGSGTASGQSVTIQGRLLKPDGTIVPFSHVWTPPTDRSWGFSQFRTTEGYLLNLVAIPNGAIAMRGMVYCSIRLYSGTYPAGIWTAELIEGYLCVGTELYWPGGLQDHNLNGPGRLLLYTGADPAAGAEISEQIPPGARWLPISMRATLVTDANVANRIVEFRASDAGSIYYSSASGYSQVASTTVAYVFSACAQRGDLGSGICHIQIPPRLLLRQYSQIQTLTAGIQAGDNWSAPVLLVEEWLAY